MTSPSCLDLEGVFGTLSKILGTSRSCVNVNSVGRYLADDTLFAAIVNILAVFRVDRAPGWEVGADCEGVEWAEGVTT
jgi:hypothetical protein